MSQKRLVELAIETLQKRKEQIELEIRALSKGARAAVSTLAKPVRKRKKRSAASRKAQGAKMRAWWAKRKAKATKATKRIRKAVKVPF